MAAQIISVALSMGQIPQAQGSRQAAHLAHVVIKLSEFERNFGRTRIHNALIDQRLSSKLGAAECNSAMTEAHLCNQYVAL